MSAERKTIVGPLSGGWMIFAISVILTALYPLVVRAQNPQPNIQYTNKAADLGLRSNVRVNPSTLGLEIEIPLGNYPGRAGLNLPVTVSYSSKTMRINYEGYNVGPVDQNGNSIGNSYTITVAKYAEHSAAGWTSSLGFPVWDYSSNHERYDLTGRPAMDYNGTCGHIDVAGSPTTTPCFYVDRVLVWTPDGASHELRSTDQPYTAGTTLPDNLYSVDGSRLRYQRSTDTLFMPDGSRYIGMQGNAPGQYVDRNGNTLTYNGAWTDTLGRVIANPVNVNGFAYTGGTGGGAYTAGDYPYSLPGVGGTTLNYTFKWRNLGDPGVLTTSQPLAYIAQTGCPSQGGTNSPFLFWPKPPDTYICNGNNLFNPVVLNQIVLPTGQAYTFTYNIYGEIDKLVQPTGAYERYQYSQIDSISPMLPPYVQANRGVTSRWVSASGSGADEVQWQYLGGGGSSSMTAPDGSFTERFLHTEQYTNCAWGYCPDGARAGEAYEERTWSGYQMLRRKLTEWTMTGSNGGSLAPGANRNARVTKEVEIVLDTGGSALAKTTTYEYDTSYEFSTGVNETATNEYDYVALDQNSAQTLAIGSIPIGSLLRRTEKTYLDATNQAYRDRNLLGLVTSVTVKDAAGNVFAQSTTAYDEGGQFAQLNDYGNVVNWTDPQTTYRGNPTTTSRWLSFDGSTLSTFPNGTYLTAHAQYDQCGSVRKTWDARDTTLTNPSQVSYTDAFSDGAARNTYAYPTSMTTAVPDSNGTFGSNAAFVATSVYDFNTGRAKSTTDANNQTTSFDYTDPLNRPKTVTRPDGGTTTYNYSDTPGSLFVETLIKQDSTRNIDAYQFFDGLGRPNRAFLNIGNGNYNTTDTQYDNMGRVYRVSNPYVSTSLSSPINPSGYWTTTAYDALGRVLSVTTPDNAVVTTTYAGITSGTLGMTVLVTDQAGRQRRSLTDALGRLVRVDEPDATGNLGDVSTPVQLTSYAYDVLGNLRQVTQASQQRFFMYDSLSRLIRAKNPEQGVNNALNLTDSITGNGQWCMSYSYDNNGNLTSKIDPRNITATYDYDALNRNKTITYTNDPASTPTVSRFYDGWRGGIYNSSIGNSKGRLWQTETSGLAGTRSTIDNYDVMGRPTKQEQQFYNAGWGQSYIVQQGYDLASHVTSMIYPSGHVVNYNYDVAGRLGDKDAQNLAFTGNLGDGTTTRVYTTGISYDAASHWTREQFGTNIPLYNKRHYNIRGQLYDMRASSVNDDADWNRGAIINYYNFQNFGFGTSGSDNNGDLLIQQHWIPDGSGGYTVHQQNYDYDSLNRIKWMDEYLNGATPGTGGQSYSYDRWGNRSLSGASGLNNKQFSIDPSTNRYGVPSGQSGTMTYDNAGNLTTDTYSAAAVTRVYDAENRMTKETQANSYVAGTYSYDGDGHRVKRSVAVGGQQSPVETWQVYDLGGELIAEYAGNGSALTPQKEYGYRNGQLLVTATVTSGWGSAPTLNDNPLSVGQTTVQARHITELRDAINALRSHLSLSAYSWQYSATTNDYISANPILEMRTALDQALGAPSVGYSAGLAQGQLVKAIHIQELRDRVLAAWQSGSGVDIRWMVSDQLGTPRMIFDQSGSLATVSRHDYLPFGEELYAGVSGRTPQQGYTGDNVRQKFTQKERDIETGLDYFGARYYGSSQGRFTSPDPLLSSGRPDMPESWNRYAYTLNNPLKFIDPDGLYEWGASLGGDASDDKVSEEIRKRRELFRATLAKDKANLAVLEKTYGKDSDEYKKAVKGVNAYGTEHDGNKVFVGVVADNKQSTPGNTTGMNSKGNVYVTFQKSYFDQGVATQSGGQPNTSLLEGLVAHEGWHVNETKSGIRLGTWDSEYNGLTVQAVMGAATSPNGYGYFTLGSGVAAKQVIYWNSSWAAADRPTERDKAVRQVLQAPKSDGGYGLSPPAKKR